MLIVTTVVAWLALLLAIVTFVMHVSTNRKNDSPNKTSVWDDEDLLQTVWLQEIEARGQAVLEQLAVAEKRLREQTDVKKLAQHAGTVTVEDAETAKAAVPVREEKEQPVPERSDEPLVRPVEDRADDPLERPGSGQPDNLPERIWHLAADGHDAATIARIVGVGRGEVELMLALQTSEAKAK